MYHTTNVGREVRPINSFVVRDEITPAGARIPPADLHARRLAREAEAWLALGTERSRMRHDTLVRKALESLAFSMRHQAKCLAVPTKLSGTGSHQVAIWSMVRSHVEMGHELTVRDRAGTLAIYQGPEQIGEIQGKHAAWFRPLTRFGARVYFMRVTGSEAEGYTLGVNVALGHVGTALDRLHHALGQESVPTGDGLPGTEPAGIEA